MATIVHSDTRPPAAVITREADNPPAPAAATFAERVRAALADPAASEATLSALLSGIPDEAKRLRADAAKAEAGALDATRTATEAAALRSAALDLAHEARRLEASREALAEALARAGDREAERLARYDAAAARAEEVAERVRAEYPTLAESLLSLVAQVVETTAEVVEVNRDLPAGRPMLRGPEDIARGVNLTAGTRPARAPMLLAEAVLPPLAPSPRALWPRDPVTGWGLSRGADLPAYDPFGRWPAAADVRAALADLDAETKAPTLAAE